jgi:two-component system, chemotaxis family, sensor histidine kinase and response regulator WspE
MSDLSNYSLLELFSIEIESQTAILNENLLILEDFLGRSPAADLAAIAPSLEALMRSAHALKGAAKIVGIESAVRLAHLMEDCFVGTMNGTIALQPEQIDDLFAGVDRLEQIGQVKEAEQEKWLAENQNRLLETMERIGRILGRRQSDRETPPSALEISPTSIIPERTESELVLVTAPPPVPPSEPIALSLDDVFPDDEDTTGSEKKGEESEFDEMAEEDYSLLLSTVSTVTGMNRSAVAREVSADPLTRALSGVSQGDRFVRVSADNLSRLMGLAGESLVEATALGPFTDSLVALKKTQLELSKLLEKLQHSLIRSSLDRESKSHLQAIKQKERECRELLSDRLTTLEQFAYRSVNLSDRLYREVINSHMRPFADGVQVFPRMVRDIGKQLNKSIKFEIVGKSTPVDRDILKKLEVPLTHILRNAIDHGIESPAERTTRGKSPEGTIRLEAAHRFGMLSITVSDDGEGIDLEKLRKTVVDRQLVNHDMAGNLTESELLEFIFLPGFSTAARVTELSGRGVGLNIAKTMVEEVGGNLQATSKVGKGMTFHFQLPLTLSVIRTLLVEISGESYAFPLTRIDRALQIDPEEIYYVENRQYFTLNNQTIGLVRADQVLDLSPSKFSSETFSVVIVSDGLHRYGLVVDRFVGEKNLVIRPLDPRLGKVQDVSAAALLEDGTPVLILDVQDIVRSIEKILSSSYLSQATHEPESDWTRAAKRILVIDDSITVREMERQILENQGYVVDIAVDGIEGWNSIVTGKYDLVVSDIDMPRLNGIRLVGQLKKHPLLKTTPVIIVSYKDREEDRLQGLEAGADYYLTKSSFHDDTFIRAVRDLIGD